VAAVPLILGRRGAVR